MQNGHLETEKLSPLYIDADLYLTPPAPSDDEEIDPMVELEKMERAAMDEWIFKLSDRAEAASEQAFTPDDPADRDVDHSDGITTALEAASIASVVEAENSSSSDLVDTASEDVESSTSSSDATSTSAHGQASDDGDGLTDSDATDDEIEILWSGHAPPWTRDGDADAANALLIHACICDARRRCDDAAFGELCPPMKRLLRCACWASHNRRWMDTAIAKRMAKLLGYHSLHCAARGACTVPLCNELRRR